MTKSKLQYMPKGILNGILICALAGATNGLHAQWINPPGILWTNNDVGINLAGPLYPLHVVETGNNVANAAFFSNTGQVVAGGQYVGATGNASGINQNMSHTGLNGTANTANQTGTSIFGVRGTGTNGNRNFGGYFQAGGATTASGQNIGAYGMITGNGAGVVNAGVYGDANGMTGATTFAGYFSGDLLCTRNAGVGVTSPLFRLDVSSSAVGDGARISHSGAGNASIFLNQTTNNNWSLNSTNAGHFTINNGTNNRLHINGSGNGNVGIGTTAPGQKLEVLVSTAASEGVRVTQNGAGNAAYSLVNNSGNVFNIALTNATNFEIGNGSPLLFIDGTGVNSGNVGIGSTAPTSKLYVDENSGSGSSAGYFDLTTGVAAGVTALTGRATQSGGVMAVGVSGIADGASSENYGMFGTLNTSMGSGRNVGVFGQGSTAGTGAINAGVFGELKGTGAAIDAGVYGEANGFSNGGASIFAGYFNGDIYVTGTPYSTSGGGFTLSDARLKKNLKPLTGALDKLSAIKIYNYDFKTEEYPEMHLATEPQIGVVAQELKEVFPHFVREARGGFNHVNYTALIPVLVEAIKEQQHGFELQKREFESRLAQQEEQINQLLQTQKPTEVREGTGSGLGFQLDQNEPNPFVDQTVIKYNLPSGTSNGMIVVYDLSGKQIQKFAVRASSTELIISAKDLAAGMYIYTLTADGKVINSKRMIVADK